MKKLIFYPIIFLLIAAPLTSVEAKPPRVDTDVYSLIAEVNNLRTSYGLPAYSVSPILMGIAQQHAEFMSVNGVSHIGYGGTRPYQRALNAGYPLAGDLSLGGFHSENITAGRDKSVQDAVLEWQGDDPHWHTMMSTDLMEIGAGVVVVDNYMYYVIDCARPLGGNPPAVVKTAAPGETAKPVVTIELGPPLARTVMPSTPGPDGRLIHEVKPGETLWLIAVTYKVTVLQIRELNYMSETDAIYPGEKLLVGKDIVVTVAPALTETQSIEPTSVIPSAVPLDLPTATLIPRASPTSPPSVLAPTDPSPTSSPAAPITGNPNLLIVVVIFLAALVLAAVLVFTGRRE